MNPQRFTIDRDGTKVAVFEYGNPLGPPVVLLHGWPDTHQLWDRVIAILEQDFRILAVDSRGSGASSAPPRVADYRIEELAGDLFAVIDAVGGPVHVLAHDWGSVVGWEAVSQPRAAGLISSFTSVSGPNIDQLGALLRRPSPRAARSALTQAVASWYTFIFQVPGVSNPALRLLARQWPLFLRALDGIDPATVAPAPTLAADIVTNVKLYRANILRKLRNPVPRDVAIPVQLVLARHDRAVRPAVYDDAEQWVRDLRREYLDAGHWSPISHPAELARLTADFVRFIDSTTPANSRT